MSLKDREDAEMLASLPWCHRRLQAHKLTPTNVHEAGEPLREAFRSLPIVLVKLKG